MTMEQYLDSVSLERIAEIRARVNQKINGQHRSNESSDPFDDESLAEENWQFLMIHTSKKVDAFDPQIGSPHFEVSGGGL